jgi:hypothetical protein
VGYAEIFLGMSPVLTILSGLFIAVATSLVTVWLALWRFHSEKWWERKAELYSKLVEALYDMHSYSREWLEDYVSDQENERPEETQKRKQRLDELLLRHNRGEEEVEKTACNLGFRSSLGEWERLMGQRPNANPRQPVPISN